MSLVNYLSPAVAVFLGVTLLNEQPGANAYGGLALILGDGSLSQWRRAPGRTPPHALDRRRSRETRAHASRRNQGSTPLP